MSGVQQKTNKPQAGQPFRPAEILSGPSELLSRTLRAGVPHTAAVVLWAVASRIGKNTHCWPSHGRLAKELNLSERSVRRHLQALQELGLLRSEERGHGHSLKYFCLWHAMLEDGYRPPTKVPRKAKTVRPAADKPSRTPGQIGQQNHLQTRTSQERTSSLKLPVPQQVAALPERRTQVDLSKPIDHKTPWPNPEDSPEQQLIALYQRKTRAPMPAALFREIREALELRNVPLPLYVEELRQHAANRWENPGGFLLWFARRFFQQTVPALVPQQAQPQLGAGKALPCRCGGGGYVQVGAEIVHCTCAMGAEVARVDRQRLAEAATHDPAVSEPARGRSATAPTR